MVDAPDRIWSIGAESPYRINCTILDHAGEPGCTEYIRADIAASQLAGARAEAETMRQKAISNAKERNAAEAERDRLAADNARLRERGRAFANQVRAVTYHLNGQAYSSTVSELFAFDSALAGKE